jgi:hypothetical protein
VDHLKNGSKRMNIVNKGRNESTFWILPDKSRVPAMAREVMAVPWVMRCPKGLTGHDKINPER